MTDSITFSKKTMTTRGTLVISIPSEITEYLELSDSEMVEVRLTKKPRVQSPPVVSIDKKVCVPSDLEGWEEFQ